ncbi:MAG: methyltransferase domain-containing protein [Pseudomonadota bacterium]
MADDTFPENFFRRQDESQDELFYGVARKVVHIDDGAIEALREYLSSALPPGGIYLDLMSSWRSHLPDSLSPEKVVGLGMNAEEMVDNPQLNEHLIHNLNENPELPFDDASFDAAFCTVSVQYMTQPVEIFSSVGRVLKTDAPFVVSFSNRCFPTKAVAGWAYGDDRQHIAMVAQYFKESGGWEEPDVQFFQKEHDPLFVVTARKQ